MFLIWQETISSIFSLKCQRDNRILWNYMLLCPCQTLALILMKTFLKKENNFILYNDPENFLLFMVKNKIKML